MVLAAMATVNKEMPITTDRCSPRGSRYVLDLR